VRILHVIPYIHPSAGGPPVVVENFVRETGRLGHLSEIISTPLFCNGDAAPLLRQWSELAPISLLPTVSNFAPWSTSASRKIHESVESADIIHVHTLWNPMNGMVRLACARHGRPYVLMPHGMLDPYSLSVKRWRKALHLSVIERRNIFGARRLIFTTAEEARLASVNSCSQKGVVIPLGGDIPRWNVQELTSNFLDQFPMARGRRQLLFLGRLHFKKGLDRILTALPTIVRVLPDVLLTVVGDGTQEFEAAIRSTIAARGLESSVIMTGRLDGAAKWGAYGSAELFLLPSRQENFAITVAEAMQMGVPVVISNRVNTWPYVKAASAGIVVDEERIERVLADNILMLLQNSQALELMGKRGQEYARINLTWARAAAELLKCYEAVLGDFGRFCGRNG